MKKQEIINEIKSRIDYLVDTCRFDPQIGWTQVKGKNAIKQRTYGEFEALISLYSFATGFEYTR